MEHQKTEGLLNPTRQNERYIILDMVRGAALLGILTMNMSAFNSPFHLIRATGIQFWTSLPDRVAELAIRFFVEGKFFTMFSFLFGLGFILFMERAEQKASRPAKLFARRLTILLGIGLLHAFFIWYGDILVTYAVCGFLLFLFYRCKPRTLLVWVVILAVIFILPFLLLVALASLLEMVDPGSWVAQSEEYLKTYREGIQDSLYAYSQGSFSEIMAQRASDLGLIYSATFFVFPLILLMFLLGAYVGKLKIIHNLPSHLPWIKKIWLWSLAIGLPMNVMKLYGGLKLDPALPSVYDMMSYVGMVIGDPALCIFYMTSIVLLAQRESWRRILAPLEKAGQMALSNYLFQSVICTTIYYSYGFGLYGKVGPALGFVITLVIFAVQLAVSRYWLRKFHFGPVEWVWRTLTYGKQQKMKIRTKQA